MVCAKRNFDICFLSSLPITRRADWSREHYAPKSRVPAFIAQQPYNIRPALKIINSIKGSLMPCEWMDMRAVLCYRALQKYNISAHDAEHVQRAMDIFINAPACNPCQMCICAQYPAYCPHITILDRQR